MRHAQPSHRQPDLFERDNPPAALTRAELTMLMPLVSMLLAEAAVSIPAVEVDNEDHA